MDHSGDQSPPPSIASISSDGMPATQINRGKPRVVIPDKYQRKTAPHIVHSGDHAADFDYRVRSPGASPVMAAFMTGMRTASQKSIGEEPLTPPIMSPGASRTSLYDSNHGQSIFSPVETAARGVGTLFGSLERMVKKPSGGPVVTPIHSGMEADSYFSHTYNFVPSQFAAFSSTDGVSQDQMEWLESSRSPHTLPRSASLTPATLLSPVNTHTMPHSRSSLQDLPLPLAYYRAQVKLRAGKLANAAKTLGLEDWDVLDNQSLDELEVMCGTSSPKSPLLPMSRMGSRSSQDGTEALLISSETGTEKSSFRKMREFNLEREKRLMDLLGMLTLPQARAYHGREEYLTSVHRYRIAGLMIVAQKLAEGQMASDGWGGISAENARGEKRTRCLEVLALYGL
jgi:hypothetical protein